MLAVWERDHLGVNLEIPSRGMPCESVLQGEIAHHPQALCARFPEDKGLVEWGAESYCGVPVFDSEGRVFGHIAIIDNKPMPNGPRAIAVIRIFTAQRILRNESDARGAVQEAFLSVSRSMANLPAKRRWAPGCIGSSSTRP